MGSEPKGPYRLGSGGTRSPWAWIKGPTDTSWLWEPTSEVVLALNAAYAEGYRVGRASRDGLREKLKIAMEALDGKRIFDAEYELRKALTEDGKEDRK
jgi:hypothetical protein